MRQQTITYLKWPVLLQAQPGPSSRGAPKPAGLAVLLCGALVLCSLPARAQWQLISAGAEAEYFYGGELQRQGDQISLWRLSNFVKPLTNLEGKEVLSEKTRTTLDCQAGKLANSEVTRFAGLHAQGEVMNHYETPLRFTRIAPDSVDALLMQKVCAH